MAGAADPGLRSALATLDAELRQLWDLGRNSVVGWRPEGYQVVIVHGPVERAIALFSDRPRVFSGPRRLDDAEVSALVRGLGVPAAVVEMPRLIGTASGLIHPATIDNLIRRYTVSHTAHRAVALFDIVGFSRGSPLNQLGQLTRLETAINLSATRFEKAGQPIEIARSTTGDGFYVWNRRAGLVEDAKTFAAFLLTLAHLEATRAEGAPAPPVRAAFSIGAHFSYHQVEGTAPRGYEYIVGDVTITLARMMQVAHDGQILIGRFRRPVDPGARGLALGPTVNAIDFLAVAERALARVYGIVLDRIAIERVDLMLTAVRPRPGQDDRAGVRTFVLRDKHGFRHSVHNLVAALALAGRAEVRLGLSGDDLDGFRAACEAE